MADDDREILHVNGQTFDTDDLTYAERREMRRLIRNQLWDEDLDGPFDWEEVTHDDIMAVTVLVFLRRENPEATLEQALACKPEQVLKADPPTKRKPRAKASATSGSPS